MRAISLPIGLVLLLGAGGCGTYRAVRDTTPELARSRNEYVEDHPAAPFTDDIAAGRIRRGMSQAQVEVTWGMPDAVRPEGAASQIWSYDEKNITAGSTYELRFDGDLLVSIDVDRATLRSADRLPDTRQSREDAALRTLPGKKPGDR